jgi:hypothetical protein
MSATTAARSLLLRRCLPRSHATFSLKLRIDKVEAPGTTEPPQKPASAQRRGRFADLRSATVAALHGIFAYLPGCRKAECAAPIRARNVSVQKFGGAARADAGKFFLPMPPAFSAVKMFGGTNRLRGWSKGNRNRCLLQSGATIRSCFIARNFSLRAAKSVIAIVNHHVRLLMQGVRAHFYSLS